MAMVTRATGHHPISFPERLVEEVNVHTTHMVASFAIASHVAESQHMQREAIAFRVGVGVILEMHRQTMGKLASAMARLEQLDREEAEEMSTFFQATVTAQSTTATPSTDLPKAEVAEGSSTTQSVADVQFAHISFIFLIFSLMQLAIQHCFQKRVYRSIERSQLIAYMEKVVENYKDQSSWLLTTGLISSGLTILSGFVPFIFHVKGQDILDKMSGCSWCESLSSMKVDKASEAVTKLLTGSAEMGKLTERIHNTAAEGERTHDQGFSEIAKTDENEASRLLEEDQRKLEAWINMVLETVRTRLETVRSLFSRA